jgi:predicted MPP superfamily phosphohydrolase
MDATDPATLRPLVGAARRLGQAPVLASLGLATAALGSLAAYARWIEPSWLQVTRPEVDLSRLPPALDGLVIAQLSDLHVRGPDTAGDAALQAVAHCNQAQPDLVVLTGDYVGARGGTDAFAALLAELRPRPAFAVLGNHDYRFSPAHRRRLLKIFTDLEITLLDNRAAPFDRAGARLWLVGVGDAYTSHDRLGEAMATLRPTDRPRILLTHYPDVVRDLPPGEIDLALAGHTHGAQVHLPWLAQEALRRSDTSYCRGLFEVGGVPLYVNRGLGTSGYRIRLFARPELTLLTLRARCAPVG